MAVNEKTIGQRVRLRFKKALSYFVVSAWTERKRGCRKEIPLVIAAADGSGCSLRQSNAHYLACYDSSRARATKLLESVEAR
jgi:hypothetical protein